MTAWWMAQLALLGTLLAIAAFGAEAALRIARKPTRWLWIVALGMTVLLGALAPRQARTPAPLQIALVQGASATTRSQPKDDLFSTLRRTWTATSEQMTLRVKQGWSAWENTVPPQTNRWLLLTWCATSVTLLVLFVGVHVRYQRRRTQWPLGTLQNTTVRIAENTGPAVIGVTSAEIVVPQWLLARDDREQRLVLEHELEHVRQHDPLLLAIAQAVVVLMPWNPAVWWMASRLRLAVELDCDRRVLQRGASARDYGTLLIDLTDHRTGFGAALPAFSCTPSHLERRLVAMTPKRLKYPLVRALGTTALASLALLAACEAKLPTSDDIDHMTASTATTAAAQVVMLDTANVTYYVNNVRVSKVEADKIAAERIATVNVTQKGMQSGGEVRLVLRDGVPGDSASPTRVQLNRLDPGAPLGPTRVTFTTQGDSVTATAGAGPLKRMSTEPVFTTGVKRADESRQKTPFTGLVIIDGVISDMSAMGRIAPDQIVTVNVIKGASATSQYSDPRAANGVIEIRTKNAKQ
jgi:beta-lactamase regulating signal transducer with metallopeptidase domain